MSEIVKAGILPKSKTAYVISKEEPSTSSFDDDDKNVEGWSSWGDDNNWPTMVRKKLEKSSIALPVIYKLVSILYGNGLKYYKVRHEGGKEIKEPFYSPEIEEFFRRNRINMFLISQIVDYKFFMNTFCEIRFNNLKTKVTGINHLQAEYSRLSIQNKKTNKIEYIGYSATWSNIDKDNIAKINLYDPLNPDEFWSKAPHKVGFHTFFPSPGRSYYAFPFWGGLYRKGGWLDVANDIPEILNNLNKNQIKLKYHIKVPYTYWSSRYPKWDTLTHEKQDELIEDKMKEIDDFLSNTKNAGKSFISHYSVDMNGKEVAGWNIEAVDDKLDNTAYIPSSEKADEQITQALGYSPSLLGLQPAGGKMGAGSGSDKRESFNAAISLTKVEEDILLEPLYVVRDKNNWGEDIRFTFSHQERQTLDKNPTGSQSTI